jgi:hypothetical protein
VSSNQLRMQIQSLLQPANQQSQLQISHTTFAGTKIGSLLDTYYAGNDLILNNATLLPDEDGTTSVAVSGTSSFLHVADAPVSAVFQEAQDGVDLTLNYQLPRAWKFSQSFPTLPTSPDFRAPDGAPQCSYLDLLTLTDACFLVSTSAYQEPQFQVPVEAGLNFLSHLTLNGILGGIEAVLSVPSPLVLSGPILLPTLTQQVAQPLLPSQLPLRASPPRPGINLKAEISTSLSFEKLALNDLYFSIYSPLTADWLANNPTYEPGLFLGGDLSIGTLPVLEIVAEKLPGGDAALVFTGTFADLALPSLSAVADLVGADDLIATLVPPDQTPAFFSHTGSLSLEALTLVLTADPISLSSVYLTVGLKGMAWQPVTGLISVSDLAVRFQIDTPFSVQRSLDVLLFGQMSIGEVPLSLAASAPEFIIQAELEAGVTIPLSTLLKTCLPGISPISDLTVDMMYLEAVPGDSFTFLANLADTPKPWVLNLGDMPLTVSDVQLLVTYTSGSGMSGTFGGTLTLAGVDLTLLYQVPGDFVLRGQFPSLSLKALLTQLCDGSLLWPSGFDLDLDQSSVLIEQQGNNLSLNIAADVKDLGLFALTVQKQARWGFALGVDLSLSNLAALPGLSILAPFDAFLGLDTLLLVFSSLAQSPNFQFPDLAHFDVPSFGNRQVTLPPQANGLTTGFNLYAQLNTTKSGGFQALAKYLGIRLDGSVGITLAVSLPDPATNSKFFLSVNQEIQKGTTLVGELGGFLQGSDIGAFLTAVVNTQVQGQPAQFTVSASVLENGVLISGSMLGTIQFRDLRLSNLALVIGIDFEGIPSLGIAATLDVSTFESSLAIFFDSTDPTKSLVAGAFSNVSLLNIAQTLAGQVSIPQKLVPVLGLVGLNALNSFSMPSSTAPLLDQRDVAGISNAFKQYGSVTIPSTSDQLLLIINQPGANWHLTDLSTMKHYHLALQGTQVSVTLEPQLYLAPQITYIGSLENPMGFNVIAQIDYLLVQTEINIQISPNQGIMVEMDLAPIVLLNQNFFSITGANSLGGPHFSLATYAQPQLADQQLRDPHFLVSGKLRLLGVDLAGIYLLIDEQGMTIKLSYQVNPLLHGDLSGSINRQGYLALQAGLLVGIDNALDLGQLGTLPVKTNVNGQLSVTYGKNMPSASSTVDIVLQNPLLGRPQVTAGENTASASMTGEYAFQGTSYTFSALALDVSSPALQNIAKTLWLRIKVTLTDLLQNPDQWLAWVQNEVISGVDKSAEKIVNILSDTYHLSATDITTKMKQVGYGADEVAKALQANGVAVAGTLSSTASDAEHTVGGAATTGIDNLKKGFDDLKHHL